MAKTVELLLTDNVDNLGIVGDVVHVRIGYARNFLLPRGLATEPSQERIAELAERRAVAERERAAEREARKSMVEKLEGFELTIEKSCNDTGLLYASVTQQDIADALNSQDFAIRPRDVRLAGNIKRIDSYEVLIKPEQDLEATIKLWVVADRELNIGDDREEMEFDNEGNLIEKSDRASSRSRDAEPAESAEPETAEA